MLVPGACSNLGTGSPAREGPDNFADDSLTAFTLPLPHTLSTFPPEKVLRALAHWAAGGWGGRQSQPSHRSPGSPDCVAQRPRRGAQSGAQRAVAWLRGGLVGGGSDRSLKREALGRAREEAGPVQPCCCRLLLAAVPLPSWAPPRGPARARCLPDFREGRNLVPWGVEGNGSERRGQLCVGWCPDIHLPWAPWGREAQKSENDSPSVSEHGCSGQKAAREAGSRGLTARGGSDLMPGKLTRRS